MLCTFVSPSLKTLLYLREVNYMLFVRCANHLRILYFVHLNLLVVYVLKLSLYALLQINNNEAQT